jgi:hypothetical protein
MEVYLLEELRVELQVVPEVVPELYLLEELRVE